MPDRAIRNSASMSATAGRAGRSRVLEPMLPALFRGLIFISTLAIPFVAALLAG